MLYIVLYGHVIAPLKLSCYYYYFLLLLLLIIITIKYGTGITNTFKHYC